MTVVAGGGSYAAWNWRGNQTYQEAINQIYEVADLALTDRQMVMLEIARYATMAPNSHNTQPWKISIEASTLLIRPDLSRRCSVVDPDDHHMIVSLGCAAENAIHAGLAFGIRGEPVYDLNDDSIRVDFSETAPEATALFDAVPRRQSTRGVFDGNQLSNEELALLEKAGTGNGVNIMLLTGSKKLEGVLDYVVQGNRNQMEDPAFVAELRDWVRTSYFDAVQTGDGLFAKSSNNPAVPKWIGKPLFNLAFTIPAETAKYEQHVRTSAGIAVFVADESSKASWAEVGQCFERFALQATSMGVLHSHINQPVEVAEVRKEFAEHLGLQGKRPKGAGR